MKKNSLAIAAFIYALIILSCGGLYMYQQKYQMYVRITPDSENDPEWPSKKKWLDASRWLKNQHYIKINDTYLLNTEHTPINNLSDFRISRAIHRSISKSINLEPELSALNEMNDDVFFDFIKNVLSYEYLRTQFNSETLMPTNDFFLFFFSFKEINYEVVLLREPYKNEFSYPYSGYVHKAGYWHSTSLEGYSYRDYVAGKPVK